MNELKNWCSKKGYPEKVFSEQVNRALRSEKNVKEKDGHHIKENGVPLVVTFNPNFQNISFLIRKNLQFLYAYQKQSEFLYQHILSTSEVLRT